MLPIGWCPGDRTVGDTLAMYPGTTAARIFVAFDKPLPAWDGPALGPLTGAVLVHVSFKTWDLPALLTWVAGKPPGWRLVLTYAHEPEQQKYGDPTVADYQARWAELLAAFADHPWRASGELILAPTYTRYWWQAHPGDLRWLVPGADAHGWDVYDDGGKYRTPADLLTIPRAIAARTGRPYLVPELGATRLASDTTGAGRSAWMRAMVDALRADGALAVCWFHRLEWDLPAWPVEQQTWRDLIQREALVTTAPQCLKDARSLLLAHLPLDAAAVGIVGDSAHRGGYHCGADRVVSGDYSVVESSRDRGGLAEWACALDVGMFSVSVAGKAHNLRSFSIWLVAQCKAGTPDTRDIREVIYSPDGTTVKRWDRLGKRTSGDDSHLFHTHISYHRDAIKAGRPQSAVFARYLTEIGILEEDMTPAQFAEILKDPTVATLMRALPWQYKGGGIPEGMSALNVLNELIVRARAAGDGADESAIVAGVLAGLAPEKIADAVAAALPATDAKALADELAARLAE